MIAGAIACKRVEPRAPVVIDAVRAPAVPAPAPPRRQVIPAADALPAWPDLPPERRAVQVVGVERAGAGQELEERQVDADAARARAASASTCLSSSSWPAPARSTPTTWTARRSGGRSGHAGNASAAGITCRRGGAGAGTAGARTASITTGARGSTRLHAIAPAIISQTMTPIAARVRQGRWGRTVTDTHRHRRH